MLFTTSHLLSVYLTFSHSSAGLHGPGQKLSGNQRCLAESFQEYYSADHMLRAKREGQSAESGGNIQLRSDGGAERNACFGSIRGAEADSAAAFQR